MLAGDTGLLAALLQKLYGVVEPEKYAAFFGAMFESTLNPETWRSGGMHYMSIENIQKPAGLKFLNPACGFGSFLPETYISLEVKGYACFYPHRG